MKLLYLFVGQKQSNSTASIIKHFYCKSVWMVKCPYGYRLIFMHDNALSHSAKAIISCLATLGLRKTTLMTWLPFPLALNPIWATPCNLEMESLWRKGTIFTEGCLLRVHQKCGQHLNNIEKLFTESFCAQNTVWCYTYF